MMIRNALQTRYLCTGISFQNKELHPMRFPWKVCGETAIVLMALVMALSGCKKEGQDVAGISEGDRVRVHYTCRLKSGELVATSDEAVAEDGSTAKSPIFFAGPEYGPIALVAGPGDDPEPGMAQSVSQALWEKLAEAIVGMNLGEKRTVDLTAEVSPELPDGERFLEMARVRWRKKEKTMSTRLYGKFQKEAEEPEVGQQVDLEPGFTGTVMSIAGDQVTLRVEAKPGTEVDTPFGKGEIRDKGGHYEIEIDAREGNWVRLGNLVGRISKVDGKLITTDFGHPFGGEVLACDVEVEGILIKGVDRGPNVVSRGDQVEVDCQVTLVDGTPVPTNPLQGDGSSGVSTTETVVAGTEEVPLGIGDAVIGMAVGERKVFTLAPYEAYGPHDPEKIVEFPCIRREPRRFKMPTEEYAKRFGAFPETGAVVSLIPYLKTRVVESLVSESTLEHVVRNGETVEDELGTTSIRVDGEEVVFTLTPKIGAPFSLDGREGRIASTNGRTFAVDFNHPLAGEALRVELGVVSLAHR
jgi:FKBP-type peptidyl-prolyl cis-trans isomerase 2